MRWDSFRANIAETKITTHRQLSQKWRAIVSCHTNLEVERIEEMKAKVKATGEIVDVYNAPHHPDVWYGASLLPYGTRELEFIAYSRSLTDGLLAQFSDQELREELKNRIDLRKAAHIFLRCRDCKHCGEGCCHKSSRYKTSVCLLKPKPQVGPNRYYATLLSRKACENFEPK